jgi:hypothetical protein
MATCGIACCCWELWAKDAVGRVRSWINKKRSGHTRGASSSANDEERGDISLETMAQVDTSSGYAEKGAGTSRRSTKRREMSTGGEQISSTDSHRGQDLSERSDLSTASHDAPQQLAPKAVPLSPRTGIALIVLFFGEDLRTQDCRTIL